MSADLSNWKAFVLAAGLGTRMRPITDTMPKPLVEVQGRALIDHALDRLEAAGVRETVVNVHYFADKLETHLTGRTAPHIRISDERDELLETGGGIARALPLIGSQPFLLLNSDSIWWEAGDSALSRLVAAWDDQRMDVLLLLVPVENSTGYKGEGDFVLSSSGQLTRRRENVVGLVYMGVAILKPGLFASAPRGAFSLNLLFDAAIETGRLYGIVHDGEWMHVGTPRAIALAEQRLEDLEQES